MTLSFFFAGILTVLLPCSLPLLPIIVGMSISGGNRWKPLILTSGMFIGFVTLSLSMFFVLKEFEQLSDLIRIGTYQVLFLLGVGFLFTHPRFRLPIAFLSGLFFWGKGWFVVLLGAFIGLCLMYAGWRIASLIQRVGTEAQQHAQQTFGHSSRVTVFITGLVMGMVWAPCTGPALGFVFALLRDESTWIQGILPLCSYAIGATLPVLVLSYGGQAMTHFIRSLYPFSRMLKRIAGMLFIASSLIFVFGFSVPLQFWVSTNTGYGEGVSRLENWLMWGENSRNTESQTQHDGALPIMRQAPSFVGLGPWHNSEPLELEDLRGKVVLIDFWTYSCVNCVRTFPYLKAYWEKYQDEPFVLIGVHSPEFPFEKLEENVRSEGVEKYGLTYPVAQDNDFETWRQYRNNYWPAKYLIDADGFIRYVHFGEGAYEDADIAIRSLLAEIGVETGENEYLQELLGKTGARRKQTPEIYFGSRSWDAFGNGLKLPDAMERQYIADDPELHTFHLDGTWQLQGDEEKRRGHQVLLSDKGEIRLKFLGNEANIVMGESQGPVRVQIYVDDVMTQDVVVDAHNMYPIYNGEYGEHTARIIIQDAGLEAYSFTFGSRS